MGQALLQKPVELLDGVEEVLGELSKRYTLVLATKGDLLDQERKVELSGLANYFSTVEIMSNKESRDYQKLIERQGIAPDNFLMVGNSLKSDVIPVLELGAYAIYIPYHTTWEHERCDVDVEHPKFVKLDCIADVLRYL